MNDRNKAIAVGTAAGFVAFGLWFYAFTKAQAPQYEAIGRSMGASVGENAVKDYLRVRFGLTPETLHSISTQASAVSGLVDAIRAIHH